MDGSGIVTLDKKGFWGRDIRLYEHRAEGYGTGEFYIDHLDMETLQQLADFLLTAPEDIYKPLEGVHRMLESFIRGRHDRKF